MFRRPCRRIGGGCFGCAPFVCERASVRLCAVCLYRGFVSAKQGLPRQALVWHARNKLPPYPLNLSVRCGNDDTILKHILSICFKGFFAAPAGREGKSAREQGTGRGHFTCSGTGRRCCACLGRGWGHFTCSGTGRRCCACLGRGEGALCRLGARAGGAVLARGAGKGHCAGSGG